LIEFREVDRSGHQRCRGAACRILFERIESDCGPAVRDAGWDHPPGLPNSKLTGAEYERIH